MSKALRATLKCTTVVEFADEIDSSTGSFYIAALETEEVILVARNISNAAEHHAGSDKPVIIGSFWEEGISYDYELVEQGKPALSMRISGEFAFELDNEESLDEYDIDDGEIVGITVAWSIDGDTPATIATTREANGDLEECVEDDEFEEL